MAAPPKNPPPEWYRAAYTSQPALFAAIEKSWSAIRRTSNTDSTERSAARFFRWAFMIAEAESGSSLSFLVDGLRTGFESRPDMSA